MKQLIPYILVLTFGSNAFALLEIRGHLGAQNTGNSLSDGVPAAISSYVPKIPAMAPVGADVVVNLPLIPLGFGLRYETIGFNAEANGITANISSTNISVLVNKRFIDLFGYFGVLATYGISNSNNSFFEIDGSAPGSVAGKDDAMTGTPTVYQVGVEGGVKLIGWILGAEVGYASHKYSDIDLSGTYLKAIVGIGF